MRFAVVDLETANSQMHSICQIGIVVFDNGREIASNAALINPLQPFDPFNVAIHGITEQAVATALRFADVHGQIARALRGHIVVCHTHFDRVALERACDYYGVERMSCRWLDSARVARRAWPQFAQRGYGIENLAAECGIGFRHHDALEDARAAGLVLLAAIERTGIDLEGWLERVEQPLDGRPRKDVRRSGDGDGPLLGETIVFTGTLDITRQQAADIAHVAGAAVEPGVTRPGNNHAGDWRWRPAEEERQAPQGGTAHSSWAANPDRHRARFSCPGRRALRFFARTPLSLATTPGGELAKTPAIHPLDTPVTSSTGNRNPQISDAIPAA